VISFYDTSTLPTEEMLDAVRHAPLGDDVYGEDPTVNELEAMAAEMLGKEASVFMPSGTMANLAAIIAHTERGDEVVLEEEAHIVYYEVGGISAVAGCIPLQVKGDRGVLSADLLEEKLRKPNIHYPRTSLVCVENTHNRAGGTITPPEVMLGLRELADRWGLRVHVDGARIFNAAVALGIPVSELVEHADSMCFSLSKSLSAPVGSILAGSHEHVSSARRTRKMLGGGMRQAGVLASAGIVALQEGIDRLADDHERAHELANRISDIPLLDVDPASVETNMVLVDTSRTGLGADALVKRLEAEYDIRASARPPYTVRFVTHRHIGDMEVSRLEEALREILSSTDTR
jgi:threonine aldolase